MSNLPRKNQRHAVWFGLAAVLCWSTVATAFKLSLTVLTPLQLTLVASLTSFLFLLLVVVAQGKLLAFFTVIRQQFLLSLVFGLINPCLYYWLLFNAYSLLPAQTAQAINYTWAIALTLLAVPLLKQRLRWFDLIAAGLCYLGVCVIAARGDLGSLHFVNFTGVMFALMSTLVWALYWIFNQRDSRDPVLGLCCNFFFATPVLLIWCWFNNELFTLLGNTSWQGWAGGIYVGLFEMGLAFMLWLFALKKAVRMANVANLIFISPFISLVIIALVLQEVILGSTLIGLSLIMSGLISQQWLAQRAVK